jgi:NAD(P)H-hydrate epimerase
VASFKTIDGTIVPTVTAEQMRRIDEVAVQEFGIDLLQMMENAGRNLARQAMDMLGSETFKAPILIAAGAGGNGGGCLCCARHLHNRGFSVFILLDRDPDLFQGVPKRQLRILGTAGIRPISLERGEELFQSAGLLIDALIGYSLRGAPRDMASRLIEGMCRSGKPVLSLDIPSGTDATTGEIPGQVVRPSRTLTLALPKTGLFETPGDLYLADIGLPPELFRSVGISSPQVFRNNDTVRLFKD